MARRRASPLKGKEPSRQLQTGCLVLDVGLRSVIKDGVAEHLTFKECALLENIMSNAGEVLTPKR
jgi:DNA-binding response OmpR family regulator